MFGKLKYKFDERLDSVADLAWQCSCLARANESDIMIESGRISTGLDAHNERLMELEDAVELLLEHLELRVDGTKRLVKREKE